MWTRFENEAKGNSAEMANFQFNKFLENLTLMSQEKWATNLTFASDT